MRVSFGAATAVLDRYPPGMETVLMVVMALSALTVAGLAVFLAWSIARR